MKRIKNNLNNKSEDKIVFESENDNKTILDSTPKYNIENAIPLEVKKGGLLILHGDLIHFSKKNYSNLPRAAYVLHVVESKNTKWEEDNWLMRPKENPFKDFYDFKA